MRTKIEVGDLTAHQWDWLTRHLPESQTFGPGAVRMCVTFTLDVAGTEIDVRHAEMSARDFINLIAQLQLMGAGGEITRRDDLAEFFRPALGARADSLAEFLRPGSGAVVETVWTYADRTGDQFDLDRRGLDGEEWTLWVIPIGTEADAAGVWLDRAALLGLYHAIGDELRATGGCDLPAEPVT